MKVLKEIHRIMNETEFKYINPFYYVSGWYDAVRTIIDKAHNK